MIGVLPVDKSEGPTSHDVVARARRALNTRRVGHTGTLDPFATGLLILCLGPATRLAEYFTGLPKSYEATARLGVATDTLDPTGEVVAESDRWRELDPDDVRAAFEEQRGSRLQTPPVYSAKKIGGKKAYELARAGSAVVPDPVEVEIETLDVTRVEGPDVSFRMHCSSGTYVRAVARDAGERLGVGAHLTALRRTTIGPFVVADALPVDAIDDADAVRATLLSPLDALRHWPVLRLGPADADRIRQGQAVEAPGPIPAGMVALAVDGGLLAVAVSDGQTIRPRKVLG